MRSLLYVLASTLLLAAISHGDKSSADFAVKDELLNEIADILTKFKKDDVKNENIVAPETKVDDPLSAEVVLEEFDTMPNDEPPCKNVDRDDKCFEENRKGLCKNADVKKRCPRTCMVCCADFNARRCKLLKRFCFIKRWQTRMKDLCPKSCEYCGKRMPAPPPCLSTKFGCCWDRSTAASAPIGSGAEKCPPCKNVKSDKFCKVFEDDCYDVRKLKGKQMRSYCPKTCRLCGASKICVDEPSQQQSCGGYKNEGLCKSNPSAMRFWCPKTCGFCKCSDNPAVQCLFLKNHKACTTSVKEMKKWCPVTCGFCGGAKPTVSGNSVVD